MLFPIGDDNVKGGTFPLFSYGFIVINIAVFLFEISMPPQQLQEFIFEFGSTPEQVMSGENLLTLLTSMFLHGGWMHLIGNMLFLWVFADNIEANVGNFRFLLFYIIGGLAAALTHIFFNPNSAIPMVGASGAISAVMGAYLVMYPGSRVKMLFLVFVFRIPAILFLGFWIYEQTINGVGELNVPTATTSGVAWWAHIGGFGFGLLAGLYFRLSGKIRYGLRES